MTERNSRNKQECNNLFSSGGGEAMSEEFGLNFLGRVPIDPTLTSMDTELIRQFPSSSLFPVFEKITDRVEEVTSVRN